MNYSRGFTYQRRQSSLVHTLVHFGEHCKLSSVGLSPGHLRVFLRCRYSGCPLTYIGGSSRYFGRATPSFLSAQLSSFFPVLFPFPSPSSSPLLRLCHLFHYLPPSLHLFPFFNPAPLPRKFSYGVWGNVDSLAGPG